MSNSTKLEKVSKFNIVNRIAAALKLGDNGKIDSFFIRIEKDLTKNISNHKKNIEIKNINAKQEIETMQDDLEDAKAALDEVFMNVLPEQVATNELQRDYMSTYLGNISRANVKIKAIEEKITKRQETLAKDVKEINVVIDELQLTIDTISK